MRLRSIVRAVLANVVDVRSGEDSMRVQLLGRHGPGAEVSIAYRAGFGRSDSKSVLVVGNLSVATWGFAPPRDEDDEPSF